MFYKLVLLAADGLVVYLLYFLLKKYKLSVKRVLIYALNPLIIIEFAGNVHMDGLMIAGLLGAVALSYVKTPLLSSFSMALSIAAKLFSLMLMPFMPREMYGKKIIAWALMTMTITFLLFLRFLHLDSGWLQSVGLWFHTFEFNASFYYLIRELDEMWRGYENIKLIGPLMGGITSILIFIVWLFYLIKNKWHWSTAMLIVLTIYFLMTTTLHPWYLGTLLAISVISGHLYPLVWTYLVFLSYSHYSDGGFSEKYLYIWVEYILLLGWMIFEWLQYRKVGAR